MLSYAFYRLPYSDKCTAVIQSDGAPMHLGSYSDMNSRTGFVVAPFTITSDEPLLLIRPDRVEHFALDDVSGLALLRSVTESTSLCGVSAMPVSTVSRSAYASAFAACHGKLLSGEFEKIVLSRRSVVTIPETAPLHELFLRACDMYPRAFVVLVSSAACGTWLAASPEILLSGDGEKWRTVALAGTMGYDDYLAEGEWSVKNRMEQRCVAEYIGDCLRRFADDVTEGDPYTARAGDVVHLRSDFSFGLSDCAGIGDVVAALHPTPAVCGLPKSATLRFLEAVEPAPRGYYSGFMGPLAVGSDTHLYVSLRCMRMASGFSVLYAGGGLLKDSVEEMEWDETEAKMETMRKVVDGKQ